MFAFEELRPIYSSARSFYKKAMVQPFPGGMILYSYGTPVCTVYNGELFRRWDSWSATTARHVNEFLQQSGMQPLSKTAWLAIQVVPVGCYTAEKAVAAQGGDLHVLRESNDFPRTVQLVDLFRRLHG